MDERMTECLPQLKLLQFKTALLLSIALIVSPGVAGAETRSSLTDELDILAVEHLDKVQAESVRENSEYCGFFGFDESGKLAATEPTKGTYFACESEMPPDDFVIVASYHTHGAYSSHYDSEVPSTGDLSADFERHVDGYLSTPAGRVWLTLVEEEVTIQLCGPGCVVSDTTFKPCPSDTPASEYKLNDLKLRESKIMGPC